MRSEEGFLRFQHVRLLLRGVRQGDRCLHSDTLPGRTILFVSVHHYRLGLARARGYMYVWIHARTHARTHAWYIDHETYLKLMPFSPISVRSPLGNTARSAVSSEAVKH